MRVDDVAGKIVGSTNGTALCRAGAKAPVCSPLLLVPTLRAITRKVERGVARHRKVEGLRTWRDNVAAIWRMRAVGRRARAHFATRLGKAALQLFQQHAREFRIQRHLAAKTMTWIRKRFVGGSFRKWRAVAGGLLRTSTRPTLNLLLLLRASV